MDQAIIVYTRHEPSKTDRQITLPSGSKLAALKEELLVCYNDIIPAESIDVLIVHWFDGKEYVQLSADQVLHNKDKVKFSLSARAQTPVIEHPVDDNKQYFIWSFISEQNGCLMKRSVSDNKILCDGNITDSKDLVEFKTKDASLPGKEGLFALTLPGSHANKVYVIKGQAENEDVIVQEFDRPLDTNNLPDECRFKVLQSFSYTQFRCYRVEVEGQPDRVDLYLNAAKDGSVKLTKAGKRGYPHPNTLFIMMRKI